MLIFFIFVQITRRFFDTLSEFDSEQIGADELVKKISHLFNGDPEFIAGLNVFLPSDQKIESQTSDIELASQHPNVSTEKINYPNVIAFVQPDATFNRRSYATQSKTQTVCEVDKLTVSLSKVQIEKNKYSSQ